MRKIECRDMGMDCSFVATGETDKEVMDKLNEHSMAVHAEEMKKMNMTLAEIEEMMRSKIKEM